MLADHSTMGSNSYAIRAEDAAEAAVLMSHSLDGLLFSSYQPSDADLAMALDAATEAPGDGSVAHPGLVRLLADVSCRCSGWLRYLQERAPELFNAAQASAAAAAAAVSLSSTGLFQQYNHMYHYVWSRPGGPELCQRAAASAAISIAREYVAAQTTNSANPSGVFHSRPIWLWLCRAAVGCVT